MTQLAVISDVVSRQTQTLEALIEMIRDTSDLNDLKEARARIEAARGWAKIHGHAKHLRLKLLTVEVEALVRIYELDGLDQLVSSRDRRAAEFLGKMSQDQRDKLIAESGTTTTAAGMCATIWNKQEQERLRQEFHDDGERFAEHPPVLYDEDVIERSRSSVAQNLSGVLANISDYYMDGGLPFTIDELAEEIIAEAGIDADIAYDETFREGVREVCRRAIRTSPPLSINGTRLPKMLTVRDKLGHYRRVPTMNATLAHLVGDIEMRKEQIVQDQAALDRQVKILAQLRAIPGGESDTTVIGRLVAHSIKE